MSHLFLKPSISRYCGRQLSFLLVLALLCSACDSNGPEECGDRLPAVSEGAFAVEVQAEGSCELYKGNALFNPDLRDPDSFGRAFVIKLESNGDENAPVFYLTHPGTELPVGTYDISNLSEVNRLEVRQGKVSVGGKNVYGRLDGFSAGEKIVEVEISEEERLSVSFDATVSLRDNVDLPDGPSTVRLRGRFEARFAEDSIGYPGL